MDSQKPVEILMVEDSPADSRFFSRMLAKARDPDSFNLAIVPRLMDAEKHLDDHVVDLILLDLGLPDSYGARAVEVVIRRARGAPVLVLSGIASDLMMGDAQALGAVDYLLKEEMQPAILGRSIDYALKLHSAEQRVEELSRNLEHATGEQAHSAIEAAIGTEDQEHDVTGFLNRDSIAVALRETTEDAGRYSRSLYVLLIELNELLRIDNDYGEDVGDRLIELVAAKMRRALSAKQIVGHINRDQFLVLVPDAAASVAGRILKGINDTLFDTAFEVRPSEFQKISSRCHFVRIPPHAQTVAAVMSELHSKGESFQNTYVGGDTSDNIVLSAEQRGLTADVTAATDDAEDADKPPDDIDTHFETVSYRVVELDDDNDVGTEIIARAPQEAGAPPLDLFTEARREGHLEQTDRAAFRQCIRHASDLGVDDDGNPRQPHSFVVSVNIFPTTVLATTKKALAEIADEVPKELRLCIELNAAQIMNRSLALKKQIDPIRQSGVWLALDQVRIDRTALEAMLILRPEFVKVHPSYVDDVAINLELQDLWKRLSAMAKTTRSRLVGLGIDRPADRDALKALGVQLGQGPLWDSQQGDDVPADP